VTRKTNMQESELLQNIPVPTFAVDARGRIIFWSPQMESLTGRTEAEVRGKRAWQAFSDKRIRTPVELSLRSEEPEESEDFEVRNSRTQELERVHFLASPVLNEEGEPTSVVATLLAKGGGSSSA